MHQRTKTSSYFDSQKERTSLKRIVKERKNALNNRKKMKSKIEQRKKTKITTTSSTAEQLRQSSDEEGFTNICLKRQKAEVIFLVSFLFTSLLFASSRLSLGCITVLLLLPKPLWRPSSKYLFITRVTVFRQGWCNISTITFTTSNRYCTETMDLTEREMVNLRKRNDR